jgi:hypothetical protein
MDPRGKIIIDQLHKIVLRIRIRCFFIPLDPVFGKDMLENFQIRDPG